MPEDPEMKEIRRRLRKRGRKGFILVRSAEGFPISREHLGCLHPEGDDGG